MNDSSKANETSRERMSPARACSKTSRSRRRLFLPSKTSLTTPSSFKPRRVRRCSRPLSSRAPAQAGAGAAIGMAKNGHNIIGMARRRLAGHAVARGSEGARPRELPILPRAVQRRRQAGRAHRHWRWIVPLQAAVEAANSSTVPQFMRWFGTPGHELRGSRSAHLTTTSRRR